MDENIAESEEPVDELRERPGEILKRAREAKKMTLAEVAEETRVAQRQLEAIEESDFGVLPGTPYAVGFARAYARAVGADEVAVANSVRHELNTLGAGDRYQAFEPADPTHIPPRSLAWIAAVIGLLLAIGYGVWRTQFFSASTDQEIAEIANRAEQPATDASTPGPAQAAPASGPVVLTAIEDVWLRIYDQDGERLFEKKMIAGETYTVPPEANNPMILTGRPDALGVTIGGQPVAPLGPPEKTISDIPISAEALLARGSAGASFETATTPSPVVTPGLVPSASVPSASVAPSPPVASQSMNPQREQSTNRSAAPSRSPSLPAAQSGSRATDSGSTGPGSTMEATSPDPIISNTARPVASGAIAASGDAQANVSQPRATKPDALPATRPAPASAVSPAPEPKPAMVSIEKQDE